MNGITPTSDEHFIANARVGIGSLASPKNPCRAKRFDPLATGKSSRFKKQLNAVILAHNYQVPEIQGRG
jgi:hypothetical protein